MIYNQNDVRAPSSTATEKITHHVNMKRYVRSALSDRTVLFDALSFDALF